MSNGNEMQKAMDRHEFYHLKMTANSVVISYYAALEELERMKIPPTDSAILRCMLARARMFALDEAPQDEKAE